jgi:hypothetical protein
MTITKRRPIILIALLLIALLWHPVLAKADNGSKITAVWANDGGDKVTRDELRATGNPSAVLNSVWDGTGISLFGARNEVVAFNLVLEAPTSSATNINVSLTSLTGPGSATITTTTANGDGVFNYVGRNIELFYVRYLEICGLSVDLGYEAYDERHIPERCRRPYDEEGAGTGTWEDRPCHNRFYPDIAVPLEFHSPFTIAASTNQSIWCDIYIPKTAPAGTYTGTIAVTEEGALAWQIPISLRVRNFTLPDLPSARTMLCYSFENINDRYLGEENIYTDPGTPEYTKSIELIDRHFQLAHRHKISLIDGETEIERMDNAWTSRLSGELFTPAQGYDGVGIGVGNSVYSIGTYGSWSWQGGTETDMWVNTDAWVNWFDAQAFSTPTDYFLYLIDESDDYPQIEQWAQWMDNNPGPGQRLMSMATISLPEAMTNVPSLDIPTSMSGIGVTSEWENALDALRADPSKRFFMYNGTRPFSGSFATEDDGVALRELAWGHFKKGVDRWFYWESTYYINFQCYGYEDPASLTNVFQRAQTYGCYEEDDPELGEAGWNYFNGDGVLFYPGTDTRYPEESYGASGPFASLRLKLWRRGIQDVDYLTLAAAINPTRTSEIVNEMVPKALWEYGVSDPGDPNWVLTDISWSTDPDVWEAARAELADIIEGGSFSYFPHIASDGTWETEIALINTSAYQSITGTLRAYGNNGQEIESMSLTLAPHGRREITIGNEFTNPYEIGYLIFEADSDLAKGYTKFYIDEIYRVAIPAVKEINNNDIYLSHIASDPDWWTGVSILNTNSSTRTVTIDFDNGESRPVTLAPGEHRAFTISELFDWQPQPDIHSAVITNASGVIGLELFGSTEGSGKKYLSGILLKDDTASTIYYPHIASDEQWWTGIVAYNPSGSSSTITITPYSEAGTSLTTQSLEIPGMAQYIGTVASLGLPPGTAWFRIDSTNPITGFELFGTHNGNQLAGYTGVGINTIQGVFAKIEKDGWTGIAFVNIEGTEASVTLTAYDNYGNPVATETVSLARYAKEVRLAQDFFTQDISTATYIGYSSDKDIVGFQLNGSSDGMMLDGLPGMR